MQSIYDITKRKKYTATTVSTSEEHGLEDIF